MSVSMCVPDLHRPTFAVVDTRKIQHNFKTLRALLPEGSFVCPMVKANAYGHGDVEVTRALRMAGAAHVGVALIEEGLKLRLSGDHGSILLFGVFARESVATVLENHLTPVLSEWHQLESLESALGKSNSPAQAKPLPVHLKFNTGMNRLGFSVSEAPRLRKWLDQNPTVVLEGVCTHLMRGDDAGIPGGESEHQLLRFAEVLVAFGDLNFSVHALNSSGTATLWKLALEKRLLHPEKFSPLGSRPGISIYGVQPTSDEQVQLDLRPVLTWKSHLVKLHRLEKGEKVSYGATWRAPRPSVIGVIPVGYADGYFRAFSNKGKVLCKGQRAPVAGIVCMDYFMVDLTDVQESAGEIALGDEVVLIGEQGGEKLEAAELASWIGTIPYEVLTNISSRVPRIYQGSMSIEK